jgi:O-antigen ligase
MTIDRQNQIAWNLLQLGVLLLSIIPALGAAGILIAALLKIRQQGRTLLQNSTIGAIILVLISLGICLIISSCFADEPSLSWLGLANFLPYFILLPSLPLIITTTQRLRRLAWLFIITSPLIVILGLGQVLANWSFNTIFGWELVAGGIPQGRMSSVFINCNFLGFYLLICFAFCLGLCLDIWQKIKTKVDRLSVRKIITLSIIAAIDLIGIIVVSSRNAWAISFLIAIAFALYLGWHYFVLFVMGIMGAIGWSAYGFGSSRDWLRSVVPSHIWGRLSGEIDPEIPVAMFRSSQWKFALHLIQERPWLGWGLRNFTPLYKAETGVWLGHSHNLFLMFGAEMGMPIAIFLIGFVGWILARAVIIFWQWDKRKSAASLERSSSVETTEILIEVGCKENFESDRAIFFTYLVAFSACVAFNFVDVSLYDFRSNVTGWLLLSAIVARIECA